MLPRRTVLTAAPLALLAAVPPPADHAIRIAPLNLELAPGKIVNTTAYNGMVPGPTLRLQHGRPTSIEVINSSEGAELVHWHGLFAPSIQDGATEEGSPIIRRGGHAVRYSLSPEPTGTRWYHSHAAAGPDLTRGTYSGQFGFLIVEPSEDPARYDQEILLAAHHWQGEWVSMQDIRKGPAPDNGLEVMYNAASFNDRALGHGEPIRVREGQHVLFRLLNASATENIRIALPGHHFTVLALDGNPVPTQQTVDVVELGVAERADVVAVMSNPGVWIMGDISEDNRRLGLGVVVEYANRTGPPQWIDPPTTRWDYTIFGTLMTSDQAPEETLTLLFEKIPGGRGGFNKWFINGKSWPQTDPLFTLTAGRRYRLAMENRSGDSHPMHLHRHSFELTNIDGKPTSGIIKDTVNMKRFTTAAVDFTADNPGLTLFHCHHQDHMDEGLMGLIHYA